jgi:hypothetical protein
MKGWQVNDELENMWKEAVVAYSNVLFKHLLGGIDKNHELRIAGFQAKL